MQYVRAKCFMLLLTVQHPINPEYHQKSLPHKTSSDPHLNLSKSTNIQVSSDFATFARILVSTRRDVASIRLWLTLQAPLDVVDLWHWTGFRPWYSPAVARTLYIVTSVAINNQLWLWVRMHRRRISWNIQEFMGLLLIQSA